MVSSDANSASTSANTYIKPPRARTSSTFDLSFSSSSLLGATTITGMSHRSAPMVHVSALRMHKPQHEYRKSPSASARLPSLWGTDRHVPGTGHGSYRQSLLPPRNGIIQPQSLLHFSRHGLQTLAIAACISTLMLL